MHHPTDRITHTTAFVTPVVEHWLEWEIAQWVHPMKDRSNNPSHHEQTLLPRSYISLPGFLKKGACYISNFSPWAIKTIKQFTILMAVWILTIKIHFQPQLYDKRKRNVYSGYLKEMLMILSGNCRWRKEGNVLFNNALNTFYLRLYGVRHMVKNHSDSERGNLLQPHGLLFSIDSKGSFIRTIPQTG